MKLTEQQIKQAIELYHVGKTDCDIAKIVGCTDNQIFYLRQLQIDYNLTYIPPYNNIILDPFLRSVSLIVLFTS